MAIDPMVFPEPPAREEWGFLAELKTREVRHVIWDRKADPDKELDLSRGLDIQVDFSDAAGSLDTALDDLKCFASEVSLNLTRGGVPVKLTIVDKLQGRESYVMDVSPAGVSLTAEDLEGMRRAIYYFEDQVSAQDGPFLPFGKTERKPWLKNRISRCFFGPIKRPPFNRDELMDDMDYYPDEYLNRLAHEGVNGLWLTIVFRELAETSFTKRDPDAPRRLKKLRRTINQCLRYGIKTWIFAIEPRAIAADDPILAEHPEFKGARSYDDKFAFCTSSPAAQQYLYETMKDIFTQLPGLGGFLNISHGERTTNCLSTVRAVCNDDVKCPRCSKLPKWQIHYDTTSALVRGMREVNPEAEMISWLYQPQPSQERGEWVFDLARHVPEGVVLQYNFESGAQKKQLDRVRSGGDYWLSYTGPTEIFDRVADNAHSAGAQMSAKIQVGCSHEVATVPFVSVPGLLYHKYRAMRRCGCSSVMQCWYFGNYPGIMNRAAGALAFEEFEDTEADFLLRLARPQWGRYASKAAEAWGHFTEGYSNYPLSNDMQYYGPMHAGITWPMFLELENKPLGPTWKPDFPPSGDTIGECLENHTLDEALILASRMTLNWDKGMECLESIRGKFLDDRERTLDIGVSEALQLQFHSAANIFKYYLERRILRSGSTTAEEKKQALEKMRGLLEEEKSNSARMLELCRADSRLGFHSEAEAHQYCEARLAWRIGQIDELLQGQFVSYAGKLAAGNAVLGDAECYVSRSDSYDASKSEWRTDGNTSWRVYMDKAAMEIKIELKSSMPAGNGDAFMLTLMDDCGTSFPWIIRVWDGGYTDTCNVSTAEFTKDADTWSATVSISSLFHIFSHGHTSFYMYLQHDGASYRCTWPKEAGRPRARLNLGAFQADHCGRIIL